MTNLNALKDLYVSAGGALTDTYEDICNGLPVGRYNLLADAIEAISRKVTQGGGGGAEPMIVAVSLTDTHETADDGRRVHKGTYDKTVEEIYEALAAGRNVYAFCFGSIIPSHLIQLTGMINATGDPTVINHYAFSGRTEAYGKTSVGGTTVYDSVITSLFITRDEGAIVYQG